MYRFALLLILSVTVFACKKDKTESPKSTETLKGTATFPVGAAIDPTLLNQNSAYKTTVSTEYNSITTENTAKMPWVHPAINTWDFSGTDYLVAFAKENNIRVHGHTLIWHAFEELDWLKNFTGDSVAFEAMFKNHIQTLVSNYKGKISSWDVVNEAFTDEGYLRVQQTGAANASPDGSIWARRLGKDYIARAFQYAHEADPDALLFYNDYALESAASSGKLNAILQMVADFKQRGIPISGLGTQMHIGLSAPEAGITNALTKLAATGLKIHISELDILVSNWVNNPALQYTAALQQQQADKYEFIAKTYRSLVPAGQQYGITNWNVGDGDSWIRTYIKFNDWPLLFDELYKKKATYYGYLKGLKK
jgi:endo-1,4-beta-xylanase